jgi:dipeptidyl aminopeptidase/acylaminoacyl peptidase
MNSSDLHLFGLAPRPAPDPVGAATLVGVLALLCLGVQAAPGAQARASKAPRFDIAHAIALKSLSDLAWSSDGGRLAFVVADPDTNESATNYDVYLADLAHGDVRRLTRNPKGDGSPSFSPSGDTLAYVGTRPGDTRPTIYMMSLHGGEPWAFGQYDEAVGEVKWSPDGRWLAYTKNDTLPQRVAERYRGKRDGVVEGERLQFAHPWVVDVATGVKRRLVGGAHQVWNLRWSPDSKRIAFLVSPTGAVDDANRVDIGVVPVEGGPLRVLGAIGAAFEWSPDSRRIAWASGGDRETFVEKDDVWVCEISGGKPRSLTRDLDESASTPSWSAGSDTLFFYVERGVTTVLAAVPFSGGAVRWLADRHGNAWQLAIGPRGRAAWIESHSDSPDELYSAAHAALPGRRLSDLNCSAGLGELGETRTLRWTSSDGVAVEGVLVRPPDAPRRGALKTLVFLHGGPYGQRADLGFSAQSQVFAAAGYQVFAPNFRSSGGYGSAFLVRRRADWGGQDWRDVVTGIDSLVRAGLADGHRLGIFGGSYGGYLTAWAITQTDRFKAAYVDRGIVNLPALWGQSDVQQYRAWEFEGRPWEAFDRMWERSPIAHIARAKTPTLIVVGDNDPRTPIAQSKELYASLTALGVPTEFVHYPREGHPVREPRHRSDVLQRALAWFDRWIR